MAAGFGSGPLPGIRLGPNTRSCRTRSWVGPDSTQMLGCRHADGFSVEWTKENKNAILIHIIYCNFIIMTSEVLVACKKNFH